MTNLNAPVTPELLAALRDDNDGIPRGLGPWEAALYRAKALAHAAGNITPDQTESWAVKHDDNGLGFWGSYRDGEFTTFMPVGSPAGLVDLARRLYA